MPRRTRSAPQHIGCTPTQQQQIGALTSDADREHYLNLFDGKPLNPSTAPIVGLKFLPVNAYTNDNSSSHLSFAFHRSTYCAATSGFRVGTIRESRSTMPRSSAFSLWCFLLSSPVELCAQGSSLSFDWSTRPKELGKSISAPTLQLSSTQTVTFTVDNVNDVFYRYSMSCTATEKSGGWSDEIRRLLNRTKQTEAAPVNSCETAAKNLLAKVEAYRAAVESCGDNCASEPLAKTLEQFRDFVPQFDNLLTNEQCFPQGSQVKADLETVRSYLRRMLELPHTVHFTSTISPDLDYSCTVVEYLGRQSTKDGTMTISVKPANTIVTLSVGPLFSGVSNRTYKAVTAPNAGSSGTVSALGVSGNSFSTGIAALANFRLPTPSSWKLNGDNWGLDVTAGPVFRVGSQSEAASLGFFAGVSFRLYRYLFLTPGVHIGQFSDFPLGFHSIGQLIPPNFPTPEPVNRTTAKFALVISFQSKDFKSLGSSSSTTTTPPPATAVAKSSTKANPSSESQPSMTLKTKIDSVDFGKVTGPPVERVLTIKNSDPVAITLGFDLKDLADAIEVSGENACDHLEPGQQCMVTFRTKETLLKTTSPRTLLVIVRIDGSTASRVEVPLKWEK